MYRKLLGVLLVVLVLAFVAACGNGGDAPAAGGNGPAAGGDATAAGGDTPAAGGDAPAGAGRSGRNLVIGTPAEPVHTTTMWNPGSGQMDHVLLYNIYDTLLYLAPDGSLQPWLAEEWSVSPDGVRIYMRLRDDVLFHNGQPLTSRDVAWTLNRISEYALGVALLVNYSHTEVVDDHNFIIHLNYPFGPILNALTSRVALIMSEYHYNAVGGLEAYRANPVGTGPFRFVSHTLGDSIVLEAFEDYWRGIADFDTVTIRPIPDVNTLIIALEAGDIDVALDLPVGLLPFLGGNTSYHTVPSNGALYFTFNAIDTEANWVGRDLYFRKAVQYAVDKEAINTVVWNNQGLVTDLFGPPSFTTRPLPGTYYQYTRNVERAREFLAMSNYDGRDFNVVLTAGTPQHRAAEVMQGSLHEVGINMVITAVDSPTFFDITTNTGDFDARMQISISSVFDLDWFGAYYDASRHTFENTIYVDRATTDRLSYLITEQRRHADQAMRLAMVTELADIVLENALQVFLVVDVNAVGFNADLVGVVADTARFNRIHSWRWS